MPKLTIASVERSAINLVFRRYADPGAFLGSNLPIFWQIIFTSAVYMCNGVT